MKRPARFLSSMVLVLICCAGAVHGSANAAETPVLAQDLANLRASGKIMAAMWTVRKDTCTLQLVFPYRAVPVPGQWTPPRASLPSPLGCSRCGNRSPGRA